MYRDDPLDDEAELRDLVGDPPVDLILAAGGPEALAVALDVLRILQGWVDPETCATWLAGPQRSLDGRSPLLAIGEGDAEDVAEALRRFIAARS